MSFEASLRRAGFTGEGLELGEALFDAILTCHRGVTFTVDDWDEVWRRVKTDDGRIHLVVPELIEELRALPDDPPVTDDEFPLVLSAGERRSFTANTIIRDASWRKRDADGALRVSPADAERLGIASGGRVRISTRRGSADVVVEVNDAMQPAHFAFGENDPVVVVHGNPMTSAFFQASGGKGVSIDGLPGPEITATTDYRELTLVGSDNNDTIDLAPNPMVVFSGSNTTINVGGGQTTTLQFTLFAVPVTA